MNRKLLGIIMDISVQMIEAGAEIHRVEDSIERICNAYAVQQVDVYATTFNVIVSIDNGDGDLLTHTRRIKQTGTDIEKLDRLNALVRRITSQTPDPRQVQNELDAMARTPIYPIWCKVLAYGVIAGAFCLFFGGISVWEPLSAGAIGILVGTLSMLGEQCNINKLLTRFLCSFLACSCAFICVAAGWYTQVDHVIIGNIMSLIPGIGLTNSLRDLFTGDSITGILRSIEALLLALAIACGYLLSALVMGGILR